MHLYTYICHESFQYIYSKVCQLLAGAIAWCQEVRSDVAKKAGNRTYNSVTSTWHLWCPFGYRLNKVFAGFIELDSSLETLCGQCDIAVFAAYKVVVLKTASFLCSLWQPRSYKKTGQDDFFQTWRKVLYSVTYCFVGYFEENALSVTERRVGVTISYGGWRIPCVSHYTPL